VKWFIAPVRGISAEGLLFIIYADIPLLRFYIRRYPYNFPIIFMYLIKLIITTVVLTAAILKVPAQLRTDSSFTPGELTDRIAIQDLINAYAHDADRRETRLQSGLFLENGTMEIYHQEPGTNKPDTILRGRSKLFAGFATLKKYDVTMHFNGQSTIHLYGDSATGEVYCLAHHICVEHGKRMLMVMGLRYYDTYIKMGNKWLFAKRILIFDWIDKRPSIPG
jgi:hypothetical protein